MKFYIDTADLEEIRLANERGWVDGVTTNPSLIAKTGRDRDEVIAEICSEVSGLVSAEVLATEAAGMVEEGVQLAKIHDQVTVKVPMGEEGLVATKRLHAEGIKTNVTLIFSPVQALMAAKAGATLISPFIGRLDDLSSDGMTLIEQMKQIFENYEFDSQILAASVRHPMHVLDAALIGADIVTMPFKVMKQMTQHPLTDKGLAQFLKDAQKMRQ